MLQSLMCRFHFLVCSEDYPTPVASYYHKNYLFEGLSSWVEGITKTYPYQTSDPRALGQRHCRFYSSSSCYLLCLCSHPRITNSGIAHLLGKHGLLQPLLQPQPGGQVPPCWVAQQRQRRRPNELCGLRSAEPLQGQVEVPEGLGEAATRTHLDGGWLTWLEVWREPARWMGKIAEVPGNQLYQHKLICFLSEMSIDFLKENKVSKVSLAQNM